MIQNQADKGRARSTRPIDVMVDLRRQLEQKLQARNAPGGTLRRRVEDEVKHDLHRAWLLLKARPFIGVALISGSAFFLATTVGAAELVITLAVAYGAYLVLREGVPVSEAADEAFKLMETA